MAKLPVPPTKSSLISVKDQLSIAREGYDLLERKREILVMTLMQMVEEVKLLEREIEKRLETAYRSMRQLFLKVGREKASEISRGIRFSYDFEERVEKIAGVYLPYLDVKMPKMELKYSFLDTFADCDHAMIELFELLKLLARMAGIRTRVWRLAKEVKKTQRRVNALEEFVLPDLNETRLFIEQVLEERERESFFIQKMLKARLMGET